MSVSDDIKRVGVSYFILLVLLGMHSDGVRGINPPHTRVGILRLEICLGS